MSKIERTNVVETEDVIHVAVRYQNGIQVINLCPQSLLTKVY
jgi:hypothetical protein